MKILILTASNPYKTAGVAALDLYKGLNAISGNEVKILVKAWDKYPDKNIKAFESRFTYNKNWFCRKVRKLLTSLKFSKPKIKITNRDYSVQDYDQTITYYSTKCILERIDFKPDAIISLFMQNFLSFKNLAELNKNTNAPIFLYMMDMAPMTGGCHYAWNCKGYLNRCGNCSAMFSAQEFDQSRRNWLFKQEYIRNTDITAIAASGYTYNQLNNCSLFKDKPKYKILLSIDDQVFTLGDKEKARVSLNLPIDKKIVFIGAMNVTSKRKGYNELIKSLRILKHKIPDPSVIHLAIAGYIIKELESNLLFDYSYLGYLTHNELAFAFQAADIFLSPSIEDSGPMMINQSIMCGTPVVAFEMGIALDLVIIGQTGYRARLKDSNDLANGIKYILELDDQAYNEMSLKCREFGLRLCHPLKIVEELMDVFNN